MGNAPKLRFEGFTDAWEQRKLGTLMDFSNGFNGNAKLYGKGTPFISVMDILNNDYITFECIRGKVDIDGNTLMRFAVEYGDVLFQRSSENFEDAGSSNVYVGKKTAAFGGFVIRGKKKAEYDAFFMKSLLDSGAVRKQITSKAQGAQHININQETLSDILSSIPSKEEQGSVGRLFAAMNKEITLHQRKCDALAKAKTFYLQNLFPQEGEKEPKLRREGFTGAWDQYSLGDLYTERNERGNETLQILTVSIHTGVSDGALEEDELGKSVRRSEDKTLYKHVYAGDLIFNMMRAWQGAIGVAKREGMISPAYISAIPDERVYPPFMNYLLRRKEIISQINNLSYGVTDFRKRLYWDSFIKVKCCLPSVEEQKRITDVFEQLDTLITRQEHRIKALKTMKKFMLQNMFPQEG